MSFYSQNMFCFMFQKLVYCSHPFYISMSSKAALSVLTTAVREAENLLIVFHMDCTFKCNLNEFPVLVFGVSDAQQQFHLLSMSVISHHLELQKVGYSCYSRDFFYS
jgi:hypothetical protein